MKGNLKSWIIGIVIVLVLLIPIVVDYFNNKTVKVISYDKYSELAKKSDFAVVYFGDLSSKEYTSIKENLVAMHKEFDINVRAVDMTKLTSDEKTKLKEVNATFDNASVYVFLKDASVSYATSDSLTKTKLETLINKYYKNIIPDEEVAYKTVSTYDEYMKVVSSKNVVMTVFGRNTCSWCNKFKPIYNEVASEYKVDIYFIDSDSFNADEYKKIMNSSIKIPASCTETGKEASLADGFGTPLTIFTKKSKSIDCISGYVDKDNLVSKLKTVGMLK